MRKSRGILTARLRARTTAMIVAVVVLALPLTSVSPASAAGITHAKKVKDALNAIPHQLAGNADNLSHEAGANKNDRIPTSLRGRHPLIEFQQSPVISKQANRAHTVTVARRPNTGYDPATSKEIVSRRTADERTYANTDGTETTVYATSPINYQDGSGAWQPIAPKLVSQQGRLIATGGAADVQIADQTNAGTDLATLNFDADHAIGWDLSTEAHAVAATAGNTADYADVARHADLKLAATATGVKETIVLRAADAPTSYAFPLHLKGITAQLHGNQIDLTDAAGQLQAIIPAGFMTDAAGVVSHGVHYTLSHGVLTVQLDRAWLADPSRRFPIDVDPTVQTSSASSALTVGPSSSSSGASTFNVGPKTAGYIKWDLSSLANETIFGAQLSLVDQDAASCKPRPVSIYPVTGTWSASTSTSWPGPSYTGTALASQSFAYGYVPPLNAHSTECPVKASLFNLGNAGVDLVQRWVNGSQANNGLTVRTGSTTDPLTAKTFAGPSSANPPRLYITHTPYNASYSIPNPNPTPPVLLTTGGSVKVTVTNKSAMTWTATGSSAYYLGYRMFDSKGNPAKDNTGKAIGLVKAASLTADLPRNGKQTLTAAITSPHVKGVYSLDFTMVKTGGPVFTDEQVPPGRLVLQVFDVPPVITAAYPQNGYQAPTLTPQLWAQGKDIDALPGSTLTYNYKVCPGTDMTATSCFSSGFASSPGWVIPAGKLSWGKTYSWYGQVKDSSSTTTSPTITLLTSVPQPAVVSDLAGAQTLVRLSPV